MIDLAVSSFNRRERERENLMKYKKKKGYCQIKREWKLTCDSQNSARQRKYDGCVSFGGRTIKLVERMNG